MSKLSVLLKCTAILAIAVTSASCAGSANDPARRTELETVHNEGLRALSAKQYAEAEPKLKRAQEVWISMYGNDEAALAGIPSGVRKNNRYGRMSPPKYYDLAESLEGQGKWEAAEPLRRKILELHKRNQPYKSKLETSVWENTDSLAVNLAAQKKFDEAASLYKKSMEMKTADLKPEEFASRPGSYENMKVSVTAAELAGLADVYRQQGRNEEAEKLFKQAINADIGRLSTMGAKTEWLRNYAKLLRDTGRPAEAKAMEAQI